MAHIDKVPWFTKEIKSKVSGDNKKKYEKYRNSSIIKNTEVKDTTYKTYQSNFYMFLCYLAVYFDNIDLYSEEFAEDAVDIMEQYIGFCQDTLKNGKKTINNKLAAVSSFYIWSLKRGYIKAHPFDKKLDRMKGANEEKRINSYFLTGEQVQTIRRELVLNDKKFNIQDQILFEIAYNSANRIGSLEKLTLSSLDLDSMMFTDIREKEGYRVEVMFEDKAAELLREWLEMRKEGYDHLEVDAPLITFYRQQYSPMNRSNIHDRMRKIGQIVGIDDFHAHCVRKSRLNNVYDETGDLTLAAELANHRSVETTRASYIKAKTKAEVRDKINALKYKQSEKTGS